MAWIVLLGMFLLPWIALALLYWGVGSFICWAFAIPFTVTFWQGLAIGFIITILKNIFGGKK